MKLLFGIRRILAMVRMLFQRRLLQGRSFNPSFRTWQVGGARVTKVVEMELDDFGDLVLPAASRKALRAIPWLDRRHLGKKGGLRLSIHSFVVELDGKRILIDTNVGNGKRRPVPIWDRLSTPFLADLERAGFPPDSIDLVVCTHIHMDHVGWNTEWVAGKWQPTFRNARYVLVREDYEYWKTRLGEKVRKQLFEDSIEPLFAAGVVDLKGQNEPIAPGLRFVPTPGHTPGHAAVLIESRNQKALVTGDFVHHPIQMARLDWSSTFDVDPETSVATRQQMFSQLANEQTLVLGSAFPDPSAGRIQRDERDQTAFRFAPVEEGPE